MMALWYFFPEALSVYAAEESGKRDLVPDVEMEIHYTED